VAQPSYGTYPAPSYGVAEVTNAIFPLPTGSPNSLLLDSDPVLYYLISYWQAILTYYCGARMTAAFQSTSLSVAGNPDTSVITQTYPYDPTPFLAENQFSFPFLAVWRKSTTSEWHTMGYEHDKTLFGAAYILPPLDAAQSEQILPILGAAYKILRHATTQGWDPSYIPPGGSSPTPGPWTAAYANLESIQVERAQHGKFQGGGNLWFPTLLFETLVKERDNFPPLSVTGYQPMTGGDIDVALISSDGSTIDQFVQVVTNPAPTIGSLSVATGPYTGGTVVTIYGTGFQTPTIAFGTTPMVVFGTLAATNITFLSSNALQVTTPVMLGPGPYTIPVTIVNPDGQTATLQNAFQFV
jgi:hypothetical protein